MSKLIPLSQNKFAIVNDEDFEWLNQWKWYALSGGYKLTYYAVRHLPQNHSKHIHMHRLILDAPSGKLVDHINGNGLDNRRENLRLVTGSLNQHNRIKLNNNKTSKYKGVRWHKRDKKWIAQIVFNGKQKYLGSFDSEFEASLKYQKVKENILNEVLNDGSSLTALSDSDTQGKEEKAN